MTGSRTISLSSHRGRGTYLLLAAVLASCNSAKDKRGAPAESVAAGVGQSPIPHGSSAETGAGEGAHAASPSALGAEARAQLTTILVSAHVGSVIARREADAWVISGKDGCTVAPARMKRALDNLTTLKAVPTHEPVPKGADFRLQISALVGDRRVVHLELADQNEVGHLTRLTNDSMVRLQGLDGGLWSPLPADWCRSP